MKYIIAFLVFIFCGSALPDEIIPIPDISKGPPEVVQPSDNKNPSQEQQIKEVEQKKGYGIRLSGTLGIIGDIFPSSGWIDPNSPNLTGRAGGDSQGGLTLLLGVSRGILLGTLYSQSSESYIQLGNGPRPQGSFQSTQYCYLGQVGYWVSLPGKNSSKPGFIFQASLELGPGQMTFFSNFGLGSLSVGIFYREIKLNLIDPIELGLYGMKLDIILGFGVYNFGVSNFNLNGYQFGAADFLGGFHYDVGLGVRY